MCSPVDDMPAFPVGAIAAGSSDTNECVLEKESWSATLRPCHDLSGFYIVVEEPEIR